RFPSLLESEARLLAVASSLSMLPAFLAGPGCLGEHGMKSHRASWRKELLQAFEPKRPAQSACLAEQRWLSPSPAANEHRICESATAKDSIAPEAFASSRFPPW